MPLFSSFGLGSLASRLIVTTSMLASSTSALKQARKDFVVVVHGAGAVEGIVHVAEVGYRGLQTRFGGLREFGNFNADVGRSVGN